MNLPILTHNRIIIAVVAMAAVSILSLISYSGILAPSISPPQSQISLPGLPEKTDTISQQPVQSTVNQQLRRLLPGIITITVILALGGLAGGYLLSKQRSQKKRDSIRISDLERLGQTLEKYYQQHGHYPLSSTYDAQYYSAINIITEWASYNFPPADQMRGLDSNWPPSDPTLNPVSENQAGNYLYYPHHFGQRFSLYAQLEVPKQHPVPNYNLIDKLPASSAIYNYRFNSPDHHVENQPAPAATSAAPSSPLNNASVSSNSS